ncbi:MAG: D-xylulose reductase [Verrucomicrobiota bacterium]|jgi:hypothetical protein|nr:D-xylulose reductase [Verrucomicrobiota bacterium]
MKRAVRGEKHRRIPFLRQTLFFSNVFRAAPPVHGCLCENVVHPAEFTFKLPENVTFAAGAVVWRLARESHAFLDEFRRRTSCSKASCNMQRKNDNR